MFTTTDHAPPAAVPSPDRRAADGHAGRIRAMRDEVERLRRCHDVADDKLQGLTLRLAEIQLNLAVQDKTLGKLEASVNGNGRPGLSARVDGVERVAVGLTKAVWLLAAAAVSATVKMALDRLH